LGITKPRLKGGGTVRAFLTLPSVSLDRVFLEYRESIVVGRKKIISKIINEKMTKPVPTPFFIGMVDPKIAYGLTKSSVTEF
jgi:hypothetical protein